MSLLLLLQSGAGGPATSPDAGLASGTGTAAAGAGSLAPAGGLATATGTAYAPTITAYGVTNAAATLATATGTAQSPAAWLSVDGGLASGTGTGYNPAVSTTLVPVWVSPADTVSMSTQPVLVFTIPALASAMHFNMQLDTVNTFDGGDLRDLMTTTDRTGWEYWDGGAWVAVPAAGVSETYAGNQARHTVQTPLTTATWYRRVRAGI